MITETDREAIASSKLLSPSESDMGFLMWIHERLEHVHDESPLKDYMHKLRAIIAEMNPAQRTASTGQGKNGLEELQKAILGENAPVERHLKPDNSTE